MRLGYCCINLSLKDSGVSTNRGMTKKTWQAQGLVRASELAQQNISDLLTILKWNIDNDIYIYRMSSDIFPWMSEYRFEDLPNFTTKILPLLREVGQFILKNNIRVSFHPGQFDVLASPNEEVVRKTIYDLDQHSRILDIMGLPKTYEYPINIHVGGSYGDKPAALSRFCENFNHLSISTKLRLVVENDDKPTQYGVKDLYEGIHKTVGCPITFDHLHHRFCTNDLSAGDAAWLAMSTWGSIVPLQHYSSSKSLYEDSSAINRSHADYVYEKIPNYGILNVDIEIEAKAKDLAVLKYLKSDSLINEPIKFSFE